MVRNFLSAALLLSLILSSQFAYAQLTEVAYPVTIDIQPELGLNTLQFMQDPEAQKIEPRLLAVTKMYQEGDDLSKYTNFRVESGKVLIQAFAKSVAEGPALLNALNAMGMTDGVVHKHVVNGMMPLSKIKSTMDVSSMRSIGLVITPQLNIGSVVSQGDKAMNTDQGRATAGVDGSGLKIGILSDTYNALGGAAEGVAEGNLPGVGNPNGYSTPVQVLADRVTGTDEGRGMAELVHDVAPGAELAFHTAFGGIADFASGILELRQAGCDIIVDDVSYFAQPYFQDDIIAQAVEEVVADGAMFFSSAGNSRNNSYEEAMKPGNFLFDFGGGLLYEPHDWSDGEYFLKLTLPPGAGLNLWLQWDEPSLLAGLIGPQQDLDILVFNSTLTAIVAASAGNNPLSGLPVEAIQGGNGGATPLVLYLFVGRYAPTPGNPNKIKFVDFQGVNVGSYFSNSSQWIKSTIVGHHNAEAAITTGAAAYFNTPPFGVDPAVINAFSSIGGSLVLFDPAGNRLTTPQDRFKPDLTGPDGGNTSFFGSDFEPDGFPNFFGTSASAPHIAALAALMKEAVPNASGPTVEKILKETAEDMNDPRGVHSNLNGTTFDYATGYGYVNGFLALIKVKNIPTLSEWGLILFVLLISGLGLSTIYSVKYAPALTTGQVMSRPRFRLFFDGQLFIRKLATGLVFTAIGALLVLVFWGEILAHDVVGLALALPLITYILHIVEVLKPADEA